MEGLAPFHREVVVVKLLAAMAIVASFLIAQTPDAPSAGAPETTGEEVVLSGTIHRVVKHSKDGQAEVHILITTGDRDVEAHLAPAYFLSWRQFQLRAGEHVEIAARKAKGDPHYLARTITAGARTLKLRDEEYRPLWKKGQH